MRERAASSTVSFEKLLEAVAFGNREKDVLSSLASRLARLDRQLSKEDQKTLAEAAGGRTLSAIAGEIVRALDPDVQMEAAESSTATPGCAPSPEEIDQATAKLLTEAAKPIIANPALRKKLVDLKKSYEQTIDTVSKDKVLESGFSAEATEKAKSIVQSFEKFIREHKDEITALQILYSRPYKQRLKLKDIEELANKIERPPYSWTREKLWQASSASKAKPSKSTTARRSKTLAKNAACSGSFSARPRTRFKTPPSSAASSLTSPSTNYDMVLTNPPFGKKSSITIVNEEGEQARETLPAARYFSSLLRRTLLSSAFPLTPSESHP